MEVAGLAGLVGFVAYQWLQQRQVEDRKASFLHTFAAKGGHEAVVEAVLAKRADVNAKASDGEGTTALMVAASAGHEAVVEALIANGACVNARQV